MKKDNLNEENHYDRIDIVEGVTSKYKSASVRIEVAEDLLNTYNGQVMTIVACNLLSRWVKEIVVVIPNSTECVLRKHSGKNLQVVIENIIATGRKGCSYSFDSNQKCNYILSIGQPKVKDSVWIDCNGWLSGCGYIMKNDSTKNSVDSLVSASFAACLGVSEIFRQSLGEQTNNFSKWFSLYDYSCSYDMKELDNPELPKVITLGNVHQIGCGAIGSSFDFILSLSENIEAEIFLIDHDNIEGHNRPASLIFSPNDSKDNVKKVHACERELAPHFQVKSYPEDYESFIKSGSYRENPPDLILCFANERNIWSTIQHKYPPITYHATTTKSWGTNFGRHIPQKDWCLMCRFGKEIKTTTPMMCSEGNISLKPEEEKLGVLPFLAPASAIITLSSLYKLQDPKYLSLPNFVQFSMRNINGQFNTLNYNPMGCETCSQQDISIYPKYILDTKHWNLSNNN